MKLIFSKILKSKIEYFPKIQGTLDDMLDAYLEEDLVALMNASTSFVDKNDYNIKGWTTIDVFNNKVETMLFNVKTNLMLDNNIFKIKNYIN